MGYKFEKLEVWKLALEYVNLIYGVAEKLPGFEEYNLKSQIVRDGTGIGLNTWPVKWKDISRAKPKAQQARAIPNRHGFKVLQFVHSWKRWHANISLRNGVI